MTTTISLSDSKRRKTANAASRRQGSVIAVFLLCLSCPWAKAGTANVANGEFDANLNGWTLAGPPLPAWSVLDYQGNVGSGSANLSNDAGEASVRLYPLRQCVYLPGAGSYRLEARGYLPAGHPGGRLVVSLSSHAATDCSGGFNFAGGYFVQGDGNWQYGSIDFNINPGFNYLDVSLGIEKDAAGNNLLGNFDGVRLIYREQIFANGFEAEDQP